MNRGALVVAAQRIHSYCAVFDANLFEKSSTCIVPTKLPFNYEIVPGDIMVLVRLEQAEFLAPFVITNEVYVCKVVKEIMGCPLEVTPVRAFKLELLYTEGFLNEPTRPEVEGGS